MAASTTSLDPQDLEAHRRELTGYCYRMLGSGWEAEDAAQETLIRAWKGADRFEGRSSVRTWLYRIATNVCTDMQRAARRRPTELGPPSRPVESNLGPLTGEELWVTPIADARVIPEHGDPAEIAATRDSIRLAFVAALQHLPAKQRTALILCEVLHWQASEVAELLDTSVASVNSALQRARAAMAERASEPREEPLGEAEAELLARYVHAFEAYDMDAMIAVLHDDAIQSMPPFAMWLQGARDITEWMVQPGPSACRGSKLIATRANGLPAFGQYKPDPNGGHTAWALQVIHLDGDRIREMSFFLDVGHVFPQFGLPLHLS